MFFENYMMKSSCKPKCTESDSDPIGSVTGMEENKAELFKLFKDMVWLL